MVTTARASPRSWRNLNSRVHVCLLLVAFLYMLTLSDISPTNSRTGSASSLHSGRHFEGRSLETLVEDSQMHHASPPSSPERARFYQGSPTSSSKRTPPTVVARATPPPRPRRSPPSTVLATPPRGQTVHEAMTNASSTRQHRISGLDLNDDDGWSRYFNDEEPHYSPSIDAALSEEYVEGNNARSSWGSYFQWREEEEHRRASVASTSSGASEASGKSVETTTPAIPGRHPRHHKRRARG